MACSPKGKRHRSSSVLLYYKYDGIDSRDPVFHTDGNIHIKEMEMKKNMDRDETVRALQKKGIVFKGNSGLVFQDLQLGNGSFGKIDFLKKYCGFTFSTVDGSGKVIGAWPI